jgi:class 3 adenylate cyclase
MWRASVASEVPEGQRRDVAVVFADLAGFTALTEAHGDEAAASAAIRLLELTHAAYDGQARLVKSLGDGVMVVFDDVGAAVAAAVALSHAARAEPRFPGLRIGVHAGPVIEQRGDVFGGTVNIASRVADEAEPGQVLLTDRVSNAIGTTDVELVEVGPTQLRHVRNAVILVQLLPGHDRDDVPVDPVCRMRVTSASPDLVQRRHEGRVIVFCSRACARLFDEHPTVYA